MTHQFQVLTAFCSVKNLSSMVFKKLILGDTFDGFIKAEFKMGSLNVGTFII
jgi:hypothetical protein